MPDRLPCENIFSNQKNIPKTPFFRWYTMFRKFFRKRHENVLWNDQVVLAHILKSKKKIDCEICHHLTLFQSKSLEKKVGRRLAIMLRVPQKMCNFCKSCCAYFYKGYQSNFAKQSINKLPKGRFFLKKNEANSKIICVLDFSIFRALYVMILQTF